VSKSIVLNRNQIAFGIPLILFGLLIFMMKSGFITGNASLSLAITIDSILTVPLVYFLLIRKTRIPKITIVPVLITGIFIGSLFLPKDSQTYLDMFKYWGLPVIELSVLAFLFIKVRGAARKYKSLKFSTPDTFSALISICRDFLPERIVWPVATEIAVIYYGLVSWKKRPLEENEFSYHKKSGTPALLIAFIFVIAIETIALHLLLTRWSTTAAWILSGMSIYVLIQILGCAKSLSGRPVSIGENSLTLRYGILSETEIPFSDIRHIELSENQPRGNGSITALSPFGKLESYNVLITLNREHSLTGLYGIRKKFTMLGLHIDEPVEFLEKMKNALQQRLRL
jgi:hypothetical protein